jgi:carboxyl-terminal processing protease
VLTDATTSGASEVFASAILANHRADVVGERTFGLASEQKTITMDNGAAMVLTVANYYNPSGKSILEEGVTPTEAVHAVPEDTADGADEDAVAPDDHAGPEIGPKPLSSDDAIFHKALDLLNTPVAKKAA